MIKLDNHRLLKTGEIIRKGDFYKNKPDDEVRPVKFSIGLEIGERGFASYDFYRRKHTKKPALTFVNGIRSLSRRLSRVKAKAKYPTVTFDYNYRHREVQVIELNDKYITGLEVNRDADKPKYQFKKFLRRRLQGAVQLVALADK